MIELNKLFQITLIFVSTSFQTVNFLQPEPEVCSITDEKHLKSILSAEYKQRNDAFYIELNDAVVSFQKNKAIIIDVRPEYEFKKYRIPNSLNMTTGLIKRKSFLKNRKLIIVGDGIRYSVLESIVEDLLNQGYKDVSILNGGIKHWARRTSFIDGQLGSARSLPIVSVKDFISESKLGPWIVIDTSDEKSFKTEVNGEVFHLPIDKAFSLNLSNILQQHSNSLNRIVFVSNEKDILKRLDTSLGLLSVSNFYVLGQTIDSIAAYKKESLAAFQKKNKKQVEDCVGG